MKKNKKLNVWKITKQNMREYGFTDAYSGKKSQEDEWIKRFCKKHMKTELIIEYIESYLYGYKTGKYMNWDLENTKIKNGEIYHNGKIIDRKIDPNLIEEKIKVLVPQKNMKEGK